MNISFDSVPSGVCICESSQQRSRVRLERVEDQSGADQNENLRIAEHVWSVAAVLVVNQDHTEVTRMPAAYCSIVFMSLCWQFSRKL